VNYVAPLEYNLKLGLPHDNQREKGQNIKLLLISWSAQGR